MGPEVSRPPNEEACNLSRRVLLLLRQALPNPKDRTFFNSCMSEARSLGLSWIEGLEYAAWQSSRCSH